MRGYHTMHKIKKGFTLIELLIVIAIIGILAGVIMTSTSGARTKAQAANTKSVLMSLKSAIAICCSEATNFLQNAADADLCGTGSTSNLPNNSMLGTGSVTYTVVADCDAVNPAFDVEIGGHPQPACDGHISVTQDGIYSGGDSSTIGTTSGFQAGC